MYKPVYIDCCEMTILIECNERALARAPRVRETPCPSPPSPALGERGEWGVLKSLLQCTVEPLVKLIVYQYNVYLQCEQKSRVLYLVTLTRL